MSNLENNSTDLIYPLLLAGLAIASAIVATLPVLAPAYAQPMPNSTIPGAQITAGTVNVTQTAKDFLNNSLNVTLTDAASAAEAKIQNGTTVSGHLDVAQGILVYNLTVVNTDANAAYNVFIDPMTGRALSNSSAFPISSLALPAGIYNATTTVVDAADFAENQVSNGIVVAGTVEAIPGNGTIMYDITVVDVDNGLIHKTKVDSATGSIVSPSVIVPLGELHIGGLF